MGETAEQWTASDLRLLDRRGWKVAHGVRLGRRGDIDHVALGPGGLLVVESKWRSEGWNDRYVTEVVERAVDQVRHGAKEVRLMLPPPISSAGGENGFYYQMDSDQAAMWRATGAADPTSLAVIEVAPADSPAA